MNTEEALEKQRRDIFARYMRTTDEAARNIINNARLADIEWLEGEIGKLVYAGYFQGQGVGGKVEGTLMAKFLRHDDILTLLQSRKAEIEKEV